MDQREYHTLILAGLLHDVGKLLKMTNPRDCDVSSILLFDPGEAIGQNGRSDHKPRAK